MIFTLIAAGLSIASTLYAGAQQKKSSEAAAKQATFNAEYDADLKAKQAEQERLNRNADETKERGMASRQRAIMEASYAKSGVLIDGTPSNYLYEQDLESETDIQQANLESNQKRKGLGISANNSLIEGQNKASAYRHQGRTALIGAGLQAGSKTAKTAGQWWNKEEEG